MRFEWLKWNLKISLFGWLRFNSKIKKLTKNNNRSPDCDCQCCKKCTNKKEPKVVKNSEYANKNSDNVAYATICSRNYQKQCGWGAWFAVIEFQTSNDNHCNCNAAHNWCNYYPDHDYFSDVRILRLRGIKLGLLFE